MLSEKLRQRLELLNRNSLPATSDAALPVRAARPSPRGDVVAPATQLGAAAALPGGVAVAAGAEHWLIRHDVAALWPRFDERFDAWRSVRTEHVAPRAVERPPARVRRHALEVAALVDAFPRGALFLDLETCGLAGSMVFLIGLVRYDGESLAVEQLLARNYAEEQAILAALWQRAAEAAVLVTFNGKTFDWPLVQYRSTYHRLAQSDSASSLPHVDVLHHARRRWRTRLPNCRLQTLERFVCRRHRSGDIPGREIPEAYRQYVATGRIDRMQAILHHNALDLLTLLELAMLLTTDGAAQDAPDPAERQTDVFRTFAEEAA